MPLPTNGRGVGRASKHWSLGCLCLDLMALREEYAKTKRILGIDFTKVLQWAVTGGKAAVSSEPRKSDYRGFLPVPDTPEARGQYVRFSRLWDDAPEVEALSRNRRRPLPNDCLRTMTFPRIGKTVSPGRWPRSS